MNVRLRSVEAGAERAAFGPLLDRALHETAAVLGREALGANPAADLLARVGDHPATLVVVAEPSADREVRAVCLTAPLVDPVGGGVEPLLAALWVDPALRGRGLARAMLREAGRILGERGLGPLVVRIPHGDDALAAMADRWSLVRTWQLMHGNGE